MDKDQLIALIENLLKEEKKNVLAVITGGSHCQKDIYTLLTSYPQVSFEYLMSPAAKAMEGLQFWKQIGREVESFEHMQSAVSKADCIILPALTKNSLAKMACGIADNLALQAVQSAFMKSKPVIALDSCWNPETESAVLLGKNNNSEYNRMLFSYRDKLRRFGLISVSARNVKKVLDYVLIPGGEVWEQAVRREPENLENTESAETAEEQVMSGIITKQDIYGKKHVLASRNARFTTLARDYISENRVDVNYN